MRAVVKYDSGAYPAVAVAVDLVVLTVREARLAALLVQRGEAPFKGRWALPGGFVRPSEDLDHAARRELAEETGLRRGAAHLEQLGSYGEPKRDPRMRVVTVAYLVLAPDLPVPVAGSDARAARWVDVVDVMDAHMHLAFDHRQILEDGIERARAKLEYTPLAAAFCDVEFTVGELRGVYEAVWDVAIDPRNFHRKITGAEGFLEATGATTTRNGGRPAQLFRTGSARVLHPPFLRES